MYEHKTRAWQSSSYWRITGAQGDTGQVPRKKQIGRGTSKSGYPPSWSSQGWESASGNIIWPATPLWTLLPLIFCSLSLAKITVSSPHPLPPPRPQRTETGRIKGKKLGRKAKWSQHRICFWLKTQLKILPHCWVENLNPESTATVKNGNPIFGLQIPSFTCVFLVWFSQWTSNAFSKFCYRSGKLW